jgi:hypothetical protein
MKSYAFADAQKALSIHRDRERESFIADAQAALLFGPPGRSALACHLPQDGVVVRPSRHE